MSDYFSTDGIHTTEQGLEQALDALKRARPVVTPISGGTHDIHTDEHGYTFETFESLAGDKEVFTYSPAGVLIKRVRLGPGSAETDQPTIVFDGDSLTTNFLPGA